MTLLFCLICYFKQNSDFVVGLELNVLIGHLLSQVLLCIVYVPGTYMVYGYLTGYLVLTSYLFGTYRVCIWDFSSIYKVHTWYLQVTYLALQQCVCGIFLVCTRYIPGTYRICTWYLPWYLNGT